MAYVTGAEILEEIPLDLDDVPIDQTEADQIVQDWIGRIGDAGATTETATSRYIVRLGATGEIGKKALRRSGYAETGEFDDDVQRADRMLRDFDLAIIGAPGVDIGAGDVVVQVEEFEEYADDL
jgi:hypothetical protein